MWTFMVAVPSANPKLINLWGNFFISLSTITILFFLRRWVCWERIEKVIFLEVVTGNVIFALRTTVSNEKVEKHATTRGKKTRRNYKFIYVEFDCLDIWAVWIIYSLYFAFFVYLFDDDGIYLDFFSASKNIVYALNRQHRKYLIWILGPLHFFHFFSTSFLCQWISTINDLWLEMPDDASIFFLLFFGLHINLKSLTSTYLIV